VNVDVETSIPLQGKAFFGDSFTAERSVDAQWAGIRAWHRWIAERADRRRQAPLAFITSTADIDVAVREIQWASGADFRGVLMRQMYEDLPLLYDDRYEPIWAACEDLELPIHFHGGIGRPVEVESDAPSALLSVGLETAWWGYRPLWQLIFAGVLERHPRLKIIFTEDHATWVPGLLQMMDTRYEDRWGQYKDAIPRRPSEYWRQNCSIGGSFLSRAEVGMVDVLGEDAVMFGNDYPHVEGTWPWTKSFLHEIFAGRDPERARRICSENPARIYKFDLDYLDPIAQNGVGPLIEEVVEGEPSPIADAQHSRTVGRAQRSPLWVMGGVAVN
jgi:predicted TIM-barrel fold metal-dependent hydrolase